MDTVELVSVVVTDTVTHRLLGVDEIDDCGLRRGRSSHHHQQQQQQQQQQKQQQQLFTIPNERFQRTVNRKLPLHLNT